MKLLLIIENNLDMILRHRNYFVILLIATCVGLVSCERQTTRETSSSSSPAEIPISDDIQQSKAKSSHYLTNGSQDRVVGNSLGGKTAEEIKYQIDSGGYENPDAFIALISAYARRSGKTGDPVALAYILDSSSDVNMVRGAVDIFFDEYRKSGGVLDLSLIEDLNPGHKRDNAIRSYFRDPNADIVSALSLAKNLPYSEDRANALSGLLNSRQWSAVELGHLASQEGSQELLVYAANSSLGLMALGGEKNWMESCWAECQKLEGGIKDQVEQAIVSAVGVREPQKSIQLIDSLPAARKKEILQSPQMDGVFRSWAYKQPIESIKYIENQDLDPSISARYVSNAFGQWLAVDSIEASQWLTNNLDKPYSKSAVERVVRWLDRRGEDASAWKSALQEMRAE